MAIVDKPAARSLRIMTSLRFHRSTRAPAIGLRSTVGANEKKPTSASAVACPVISHAQIVSANRLMPEPTSEMN